MHDLKRVVALLVKESGFDSASDQSIERLSLVFQEYLLFLLEQTKKSAESGGRTRPNLDDLRLALASGGQDPSSLFEYSGLSSSLSLPAAQEIPDQDHPLYSWFDVQEFKYEPESEKPKYVTSFCPQFPSKHTFVHSRIPMEYESSATRLRELQSKQTRQGQENLAKLMESGKGLLFKDGHVIVNYKRFY